MAYFNAGKIDNGFVPGIFPYKFLNLVRLWSALLKYVAVLSRARTSVDVEIIQISVMMARFLLVLECR